MAGCSNTIVGILNFMVLLFSIPILAGGILLSLKGSTECERFLDKPLITLAVFLIVLALAGFIGSCCRVTWLLWVYLVVMFLLILVIFCFTVFAFAVTKKGAGQTISGRGYKEYKVGEYSNWLQNRVKNAKHWNKIKTCLVGSKVCPKLEAKLVHVPVNKFYNQHLTAIQSGCCKPSDQCGFTYVSATNLTKTAGTQTNLDCGTWDNAPNKLCFDCLSCKAGILDTVKSTWKENAISNIMFVVFLIIVYSITFCSLRNNKMHDDTYGLWP